MTLLDGVRAYARAVTLLRRRELASFAWIPALVALAIVGPSFALGLSWLDDRVTTWIARLPEWLDFLGFVLGPLIYVVGILMGAWLLGYVAVLVASPFLGVLSARTERLVSATVPSHETSLIAGSLSAFAREARKLAYHLPRLALVFVVTLVPGLAIVAPALWFLFGAWMMAVQFVDYAGENRGLEFRHTLERLRRRRLASLGFGACALAGLAIPFASVVTVPIAVIGGTLLWHRLEHPPTR